MFFSKKRLKKTQLIGKIPHILGLEGYVLLKKFMLCKAIYRSSAIPSKIPMAFFFFTEIVKPF